MIKAQIQPRANGAMLFDAGQMASADEHWFEQASAGSDDGSVSAGRGAVVFFDAPFGACVLRHYRRGGLVAHLNSDRYLWTGRKRTRCIPRIPVCWRACTTPACRCRRH